MGRFTCDSCGRDYAWKLELAGRKVRCKCGEAMTAPTVDPEESSYELAPEPITFQDSPRTATQTIPAPVAATSTLSYQSAKTEETPGVDAYIFDKMKDLHIPLALVAAGTVVHFGEMLFRLPDGAKSYSEAFMQMGVGMIVTVTIMLVGLFIAAKLRGLAFGPFWIALLKLCAIAIAPGAAFTLITLLFKPFGILAALGGFIASFCLYFALFGVLFDLDESDTWFCVCVIFVLHIVAVFIAL